MKKKGNKKPALKKIKKADLKKIKGGGATVRKVVTIIQGGTTY